MIPDNPDEESVKALLEEMELVPCFETYGDDGLWQGFGYICWKDWKSSEGDNREVNGAGGFMI